MQEIKQEIIDEINSHKANTARAIQDSEGLYHFDKKGTAPPVETWAVYSALYHQWLMDKKAFKRVVGFKHDDVELHVPNKITWYDASKIKNFMRGGVPVKKILLTIRPNGVARFLVPLYLFYFITVYCPERRKKGFKWGSKSTGRNLNNQPDIIKKFIEHQTMSIEEIHYMENIIESNTIRTLVKILTGMIVKQVYYNPEYVSKCSNLGEVQKIINNKISKYNEENKNPIKQFIVAHNNIMNGQDTKEDRARFDYLTEKFGYIDETILSEPSKELIKLCEEYNG